jgi:hypothetical protein
LPIVYFPAKKYLFDIIENKRIKTMINIIHSLYDDKIKFEHCKICRKVITIKEFNDNHKCCDDCVEEMGLSNTFNKEEKQ